MKHRIRDFLPALGASFAFACFMLAGTGQGHAQSIQRQSLGICGANMVSDGVLIKQTIGQPYATNTYYNGVGFRPGFQQPTASPLRSVIAKELHQPSLNLRVYPNPATASVKIESTETIQQGFLKVLDSQGRLVVSEQLSELTSHTLNCENWNNGLYLISVSTDGKASYTSKLLISK